MTEERKYFEGLGQILNPPASVESRFDGRERLYAEFDRLVAAPECRSILLVGPAGSGKTAMIDEFARRRPLDADGLRVLRSSGNAIFSGTRYLGEWQTRAQRLVKLGSRADGVVVHFTDLHLFPSLGRTSEGLDNLADFFQPFIERGEIQIIAETTSERLQESLDRHPSFRRLFQVLEVRETGDRETAEILQGLVARKRVESMSMLSRDIDISPRLLDRTIELARAFVVDQANPGRSLHLLSSVIDASRSRPSASPHEEPVRVAESDLLAALESSTGVPARLLDDQQTLDLAETRRFFEARVVGQERGVEAMTDLVTLIKAGLTDPQRPLGVLLFVGPTGVGKTELAKALAEFVFGSADRLLRLDMSEYKDYGSFQRLIGDAGAPEGSPLAGGTLAGRVHRQPFSVVLLDEFEKAHPNVYDLLLAVLDDGRLTDARGRTTSFAHTIVIMTSNAGSDLERNVRLGFGRTAEQPLEAEVQRALSDVFRPEFLNRIGRVVVFSPLNEDHMRTLARREIGKALLLSGVVRRNLRVSVAPEVHELVRRLGFDPVFGARPLKRAVERQVLVPLGRQIIALRDPEGVLLELSVGEGESVQVKVVRDRTTRQEKAAVEGPVAEAPVARPRGPRGRSRDVLESARALARTLAEIEARFDRDAAETRRGVLLASMSSPDFWDEPVRARSALTEMHRIDRRLESLSRIRGRVEELVGRIEHHFKLRDEVALASLDRSLPEVRRHLDIVGYSISCDGDLGAADAFIVLSLVDKEPGPQDPVGRLAGMYEAWARRKGFEVTFLHRVAGAGRGPTELILHVAGVAVMGVLEGEDGIHEFDWKDVGSGPRQKAYVRVEVLPELERGQGPALVRDEIETDPGPKGRGSRRGRRGETGIFVRHRASGIEVRLGAAIDGDELLGHAEELLRARLWRSAAPRPDPEITRRYTLSPRPQVKDLSCEVTLADLDAVLSGEIDPFIEARLRSRGPEGPTAQ